MAVRMPRGGGYGYDYGMELSLDDPEDPDVLAPERRRAGSSMFDRMRDYGGKAGGMFEGIGQSVGPYSNRLMLTGMGLLSGKNRSEGWEGAMKGLVAGSAMDTERGGRRALEGLMNAEGGVFSDLAPEEREALSKNPEIAAQAFGARLKPRDPLDMYDFVDVDGVLHRVNKYNGESSPVSGGSGPGTGFKRPSLSDVSTWSKDYAAMPGVAKYRTTVPYLSSMSSSIYDTSKMSDYDFVYGLAQVFDPGSMVREAEQGFVLSGQSVPDSIRGQLAHILAGGSGVSTQARKDLVAAARRRVAAYYNQAMPEYEWARERAMKAGFDPDMITPPLEELPEIPEPGEVTATPVE